MTIKVLIADDHKLFRQGLIGLMKTREDLAQVVGEAETGVEAIQLTEKLQIGRASCRERVCLLV